MKGWTQGEQQKTKLLRRRQYEMEQPMARGPRGGEQQKTELLQRRQYKVQLFQGEQPMVVWTQGEQQRTKLLLRRQYEMQLPQEEQLMEEWTQGEQQKTEMLLRRQYEMQLLQEEVGEGACLPLYLDHSPSCSSSTEIPVLAPSPHPR